jgi:hypothetical protein
MRRTVLVSSLAVTTATLGACRRSEEGPSKPTASAPAPAAIAPASPSAIARGAERMRVVTSDTAPLLPEIGAAEDASQVLHAGDVVLVERELVPLRWTGAMDGVVATREGPMVAIRRARGDAVLFGFKSDLGDAVDAPDAPWVCARIERHDAPATARDTCTARLRRARLPDGGFVAYVNCGTGACPVAVARGDAIESLLVEGVVDTRLATITGRPALMQSTRWVKDEGKRTGGVVVTVTLDGPKPAVAARIPADEVDARAPGVVVQRNVKLDYGDTDVHVTGELRTIEAATGKTLETKPIDERHALLGP